MSFVGFADFTHNSVPHVPASKAMPLVAVYATGSGGIEATAQDIAKYHAAGTGVVLIDQTPSLAVFAVGKADVADVESGAGTMANAANAVLARQARGWESTLYVGYANLSGLIASLHPTTNLSKVFFGVADYSWSLTEAESLLNSHPQWAYVQYGDPKSNPTTLIPGTGVTLANANADIDVAKGTWASAFIPSVPNPAPPAVVSDGVLVSHTMGWTGHLMKSADHGKTWTAVNP